MLCVAAVSALVVQLAVGLLPPPLKLTAAQPAIALPPSLNATAPLGVLQLTVAVHVTLAPTVEGLSELGSLVVVASFPARRSSDPCDNAVLVDPASLASPP